jgi:hypothetical protein
VSRAGSFRLRYFNSNFLHNIHSYLLVQDKLPEELVRLEKASAPAFSKQEIIEEEGDVSTVESTADEPVQEEAENSDPTGGKYDEVVESTKDMVTTAEGKEQSSSFACCQGSSADVLKNLQAAVGMA